MTVSKKRGNVSNHLRAQHITDYQQITTKRVHMQVHPFEYKMFIFNHIAVTLFK